MSLSCAGGVDYRMALPEAGQKSGRREPVGRGSPIAIHKPRRTPVPDITNDVLMSDIPSLVLSSNCCNGLRTCTVGPLVSNVAFHVPYRNRDNTVTTTAVVVYLVYYSSTLPAYNTIINTVQGT